MKKLGLIVLLIALAAAYGAMQRNGDGRAAGSEDLSLRVRTAADRLEITNMGSTSVAGCTVLVNSRFRREDLRLPRNEVVSLPLASLIGGQVRFAAGTDSIERVHVLCTEPRTMDGLFKP